MYDTEIRVVMVEHRVVKLHRKQENRLTAMLSALCLALSGSLAGAVSVFVGRGQGRVPELYGTTMLLEDVGGYVLVGVIAFIAAVVITVLCIRYREKEKKSCDKKEEDNK